jgi:hypothetical protein
MSTMPTRAPIIGGVAGGSGTSLVAGLLGTSDVGVVTAGDPVDVLVCRSTSAHLTLATQVAIAAPRPPIVVVSADAPLKTPAVVRDRARMLTPNVPGVLWLGFLEPLRTMTDPIAGAREAVLTVPTDAAFRKAFEFRQELVDAVIALLANAEPTDSAGYDQPIRRTS